MDTETAVIPVPKLKTYTPSNCSACAALRPERDANYVSVYHTRRDSGYVIRYCKCAFCGNTFKESSRV